MNSLGSDGQIIAELRAVRTRHFLMGKEDFSAIAGVLLRVLEIQRASPLHTIHELE